MTDCRLSQRIRITVKIEQVDRSICDALKDTRRPLAHPIGGGNTSNFSEAAEGIASKFPASAQSSPICIQLLQWLVRSHDCPPGRWRNVTRAQKLVESGCERLQIQRHAHASGKVVRVANSNGARVSMAPGTGRAGDRHGGARRVHCVGILANSATGAFGTPRDRPLRRAGACGARSECGSRGRVGPAARRRGGGR